MAVTPNEERFTAPATGVAAGGDALAHHPDGRVAFVEGALPGEVVACRVVTSKRDYVRAVAVDIVEPSPDRVVPPCPVARRGCGGCQWQHARPPAQAAMKRAIVADALRRLAHVDDPPMIDEVPAVPPSGYRTTLRLAVSNGRAAYRHRHSHDLVEPDVCLIAHPRLEELVTQGRFDGCDEVLLRVGAATGDRLVVATPTAAGVQVPPDVLVVGDDEGRRARRAAITEVVAGARLRISAPSFFQSGPAAAELLVAAVIDAVGSAARPGATIIDAYGGVGLLGGALARASGASSVIVIEQAASAASDAAHNLADLDVEVVRAEVASWSTGEPADVVIADPSRSGLGPSATAALAATAAPVLVLVSCDPASFGRDVRLLAGHGYRLASVQVLDLFPHTFHVEVVSRFELG